MNPREFLVELQDRFPRGRLTEAQENAFCQDVRRFSLSMGLVQELAEGVSTAFPSIADIAKRATKKAEVDQAYRRPHTWTRTGCKHCHGEGRIAVFGTMLYGDTGDTFEIEVVFPYSQCVDFRKNTALTEMFAHCVCDAGDAPTLGRGVKKWNGHMRVFRNSPVTT